VKTAVPLADLIWTRGTVSQVGEVLVCEVFWGSCMEWEIQTWMGLLHYLNSQTLPIHDILQEIKNKDIYILQL
jgi:hypothetical protein